jgi:hypothetical protein
MDPWKRRHTWDVLLKHKQGRTMVFAWGVGGSGDLVLNF